jgi:nitroimidazol reductase NimA-like FMN-containing flavoprotein (pyridoxamine 5'-phosphate oxidase superfamily)
MEPNDSIEQQRVIMVIEDLAAEASWSRLAQVPTGRLCFVDSGEPMVLPLNHVVDGHSIVVRTASGTAAHRLGNGATVAFEADATQPATCEGWSVVVRGHLAEVTDEQELAEVSRLPLHPWASGHRDHFLRLRPWAITGREIRARVVDDEWRL